MCRTASIVLGLLGLVIPTIPAFADQASLPLGTWKVDVSKLPMQNPPDSVTIVLKNAAGGRYRMIVDIVDHGGGKRHADTTFTPAPAVGNADYDVVTMTMPSRRILVMGGGYKGNPSNTRVFSPSDDGKHMIETVITHTDDGTPHSRVDFWDRSGTSRLVCH
jgi:hypothetical protein